MLNETTAYTFVFIISYKYIIFINGPRCPRPRSPSNKIDLGRLRWFWAEMTRNLQNLRIRSKFIESDYNFAYNQTFGILCHQSFPYYGKQFMHFRCLLSLRKAFVGGFRGKSTRPRVFVTKDIMSQDVNVNKNKVYKVVLTGGMSCYWTYVICPSSDHGPCGTKTIRRQDNSPTQFLRQLTIFALICWFPGTQKTNTGNPGSQIN